MAFVSTSRHEYTLGVEFTATPHRRRTAVRTLEWNLIWRRSSKVLRYATLLCTHVILRTRRHIGCWTCGYALSDYGKSMIAVRHAPCQCAFDGFAGGPYKSQPGRLIRVLFTQTCSYSSWIYRWSFLCRSYDVNDVSDAFCSQHRKSNAAWGSVQVAAAHERCANFEWTLLYFDAILCINAPARRSRRTVDLTDYFPSRSDMRIYFFVAIRRLESRIRVVSCFMHNGRDYVWSFYIYVLLRRVRCVLDDVGS
jgi:hypothetical protein